MSVVIMLIGFSLIVALGFLVAFIWSVKTGQYEDHIGPSVRILFDDEKPADSPAENEKTTGEDKTGQTKNH